MIREAGSVSQLLVSLKANDQAALQRIYQRYLRRLMRAARCRLRQLPSRVADEEDVAHAVLFDLFRGVRSGGFPKLNDRDDLWQVLIMLTQRRTADLKRWICSQKRSPASSLAELAAMNACGSACCRDYPIEHLIERRPGPEFAAEFIDLCNRLFSLVKDPLLRQIVIWKIEGHANSEIAAKIGRATRTVERKLRIVCELLRADSETGWELEPSSD
jgi:DNA-directed RNA polymerase specialized sigma24 family protein